MWQSFRAIGRGISEKARRKKRENVTGKTEASGGLINVGMETNSSDFWVKRSKLKVAVEYSVLETAVCRRRLTVLNISRTD